MGTGTDARTCWTEGAALLDAALRAARERGASSVASGAGAGDALSPRGRALELMEARGLEVLPACWPGVMGAMASDALPGGRGWALCGPSGAGKTARARLAAKFAGVEIVTARQLYEEVKARKGFFASARVPAEAGERRLRGCDLVIDHLGEEPPRLSEFGVVSDPVGEILAERLSRWPQVRTYVATRLDPAGLAARYGADTAARLERACGWLVLPARPMSGNEGQCRPMSANDGQ